MTRPISFSLSLLHLIKELCLISFKKRTGCARRGSTEREKSRRIFISYATDNKFQYLNYNLRVANEKRNYRRHEEKTRKNATENIKLELGMKFCGSLSGWNCTFYLRIASHFADTAQLKNVCTLFEMRGEGRIGHKLNMRMNADCNINARKFKSSLSTARRVAQWRAHRHQGLEGASAWLKYKQRFETWRYSFSKANDSYWSEPVQVVYVTLKHFRSTMSQIHFNNLSSPLNQKTSSDIVTKLTLSFTVRHDEARQVHTLLKSVLSDALEPTIQIVSLRRIKEGRAVSFPFCNYSVSEHTTLLTKSNQRWKSFFFCNNVVSARIKLNYTQYLSASEELKINYH